MTLPAKTPQKHSSQQKRTPPDPIARQLDESDARKLVSFPRDNASYLAAAAHRAIQAAIFKPAHRYTQLPHQLEGLAAILRIETAENHESVLVGGCGTLRRILN